MIMNVDDWHASFARMDRAAMLALAPALVRVKLLKQRWQVFHNALQPHFRAIDQLMATWAVPFERIQRALRTRHLNHHPDGISRPLWRMTHVFGQKKNLALFDRHFQRRLARRLHKPERNTALPLT